LYRLLQYIRYFFLKEDRHSLQSPTAFNIYEGLLRHKKISHNTQIEGIRHNLLKNDTILPIRDLGAGSRKLKASNRKVKDVVKYSNSPRTHNLLYQYFLSLTPAKVCIELGTGVGINAAYLSEATKGTLYTIEGDEGLQLVAAEHLHFRENIVSILGNISDVLPQLMEKHQSVDFALIDGNHTYRATVDYFNMLVSTVGEDSIIIIGDIYWSKGMTMAWKEIASHPKVSLSFDFFECGVLFFKTNLTKAHYIMHY